ncbi:TonB-dependent receptor [Granulicella paludicola]|uniref:TonB-dependent receptor n=1 Tax=Granulicella paludicola TaxID=474951 RepID=UPI0021E0111B|nr:TonB-dependent receptor [Granulicella paludicola]
MNPQNQLTSMQRIGFGRTRVVIAAAILMTGTYALFPELTPSNLIAHAQNTNATIRGQVLDPTGALVPSASILIVNKETGVTVFNGKTDSAGTFVAPQVIPGIYKVTVTAPDLKQSVTDNLQATVAQIADVTVKLELGESTEVVTVESKGEQLDSSTSDVSTLITPADVQNLPIQGRTTENLLAFIPGVAHGGGGTTPSTSQLSINGSRTLNTEVLLNGVSTIVASTGTPLTLPSPDGVDSFRALTTNAPAEYGRTSGAVISVNTRSGANAYHGSLYFLMKNEDFDANTYFHKLTSPVLPRNKDRFFQMGGSLGGPIRVPWLFNGHDKAFFFFNYDRTLQPSSTTITETVPTADMRAGHFSYALAPVDATGKARAPQQLFYPGPRGAAGGTTTVAIPNNDVSALLDPASVAIMNLLPLPNAAGTYDPVNNRYTSNWQSLQNLSGHYQRIVGRVDLTPTLKDRFSINIYRYTTATPNAVTYNSQLLNTTWDCTCNNAWLPSIDWTRSWSSSLVSDLNMGFFRNVVLRNPPGQVGNVSQTTGIASLPINQFPELTDPGFSNIGSDTNTNQVNITNTFTPFGTVTKTFGPHTFKMGGSLRKNQFNSYNPAASPEGSIAFDGSITNHGASGTATSGVADFMLGEIKTASYEQPMPETGRRNYNLGLFFQDDYRVTPKLTLNLGLRYEIEGSLYIATNVYSRFDPNTGALLVAGQNGVSRSLNVTEPKADFSPRIGLAYSVNDKTVIRAAFGTFYGTIFQNLGGQLAYPGYDNSPSYNNLGTGIAQPFSLSQGLPLVAPVPLSNPGLAIANATVSNPYSPSGVSFNELNPMALVQQWNLGFQRKLPLAMTLEVNYIGNHALHLAYVIPANIVPLTSVDAVTLANNTTATQNAVPFHTIKSFSVVDGVGNSNYNSLQATLKRDFNRSLAVLSNYTYAKEEDDGSTIYNFAAPNGTANAQYTATGAYRSMDFTVGNIDAKHTLNIAMIYTTPGPWWLRDWHISPVFVGRTGLPVNVTQTNEISNVSQQRPNGNPQLVKLAHPYVNGSSIQYWDSPQTDTTSFALTPSGPVYNTIGGVRTRIVNTGFGNVPRDSNRAPGEVDFDASVAKDFPIYGRFKFQIRFDAFNVINHTNFSAPSGSLSVGEQSTAPTVANFQGSTAFGKITGTGAARTMQASTRIFF